MKVQPLAIDGVLLFEPDIFADERGFLFESFNLKKFQEHTGLCPNFVQDNHSYSHKGVLRGLHYQLPPHTQEKLVRVVQGEVFDVSVDIRRDSPTFGQWAGVCLSAGNARQLWIPSGFAHGYVVLSDSAEVLYKATDYYVPSHERCIAWNDPAIGIDWPIPEAPQLSVKDRAGKLLSQTELPEKWAP